MKKIFPSNKKFILLIILMLIVGLGFLVMLAVTRAFPRTALTFILVVLCLTMWLAIHLMKKEKKPVRVIGIIIGILYIIVFGMGAYYLGLTHHMISQITLNSTEASAAAKRVDVMEESFNVYITGIDQWDSEKGLDLERSDVNMIVSVCPKTRKVLLTSLPRDSYVPLHRTGTMDKLTHTGIYGVDETLYTVEDWLDIDLNYYVKTNFSAIVEVIDAIDGIDVYSDREFNPVKRPWWTVEQGWNHMSGKEALAFARERRAYDEDDSKRVLNQQKVVKAMMDKMVSSTTILTKYDDIMLVAGDSLETNMPMEDIQTLVEMQMTDLGKWNVETQRVQGEYDMDYVASMAQTAKYQVYKVSNKSIAETKDNIKKAMNPSTAEIAKAAAERGRNSIYAFFKGIFKQ